MPFGHKVSKKYSLKNKTKNKNQVDENEEDSISGTYTHSLSPIDKEIPELIRIEMSFMSIDRVILPYTRLVVNKSDLDLQNKSLHEATINNMRFISFMYGDVLKCLTLHDILKVCEFICSSFGSVESENYIDYDRFLKHFQDSYSRIHRFNYKNFAYNEQYYYPDHLIQDLQQDYLKNLDNKEDADKINSDLKKGLDHLIPLIYSFFNEMWWPAHKMLNWRLRVHKY